MNDDTVTQLLRAADSGDREAFQRLYVRTYDELRRLAHRVRDNPGQQTLNTTALVHEAYMKLVPGAGAIANDRVHFFRIAARAMRQVLVDAARRRATRNRGNALLAVETVFTAERMSHDVLDLESALVELESISPRQTEVIECRFFAGLSVEETAAALGISTPTVKREWRVARAWLAQALSS
ncbi:MAG TPA: ECF-type sigma factor [Longimicrobiales bacterium]|nr:ECF-type sigma factor [Longimicrobiales bacterium]